MALVTDFDFHRYLAALQTDGMNYTRMFGGSYIEVPAKSTQRINGHE